MEYPYNTASPDRYKLLKELAEEHKRFPTEAEAHLWRFLCKRQLGVKFNRQHVIGDYIVDFVCLDKLLVVEVDGGYHYGEEQRMEDEQRTRALARMGFRVIRFDNQMVFSHTEEVIEKIIEELKLE